MGNIPYYLLLAINLSIVYRVSIKKKKNILRDILLKELRDTWRKS